MYWLSQIGSGAGPLILSWINEICSEDTEKRALLVAAGNDFAYVVQAVAPNFVWKTTDFPRARKGYTWSLILQVLLGKFTLKRIEKKRRREKRLTDLFPPLRIVLWTALIQLLLWRDKRRLAAPKRTAVEFEGEESFALEANNHLRTGREETH